MLACRHRSPCPARPPGHSATKHPTSGNRLMDTTSARDRIFARIRAAQGRAPGVSNGERAAVADYLARHPAGPRPPAPADRIQAFHEQAQKMASTVERVAAMADVPAAAARYLDSLGLARRAVAWDTLAALDWQGQGLTMEC